MCSNMLMTVIIKKDSVLSIKYVSISVKYKMNPVMRKPGFALREQQRCRSACASAQSDQHLCRSLPR